MNGFYHTLKRFKLASVLNLLGLTAAFTACYVLCTQVEFAQNYNKNISEHENLYRLEIKLDLSAMSNTLVTRPIAESMELLPQVESLMLWFWSNSCEIKIGEDYVTISTVDVTNNGIKALRPQMLCGADTLSVLGDCIIPRSIAEKVFGTIDVVGKSFDTNNNLKMQIKGVFEDFPENCTFSNSIYWCIGNQNKQNNENWNYYAYYRLATGTDKSELEKRILQHLIELELGDNATDEERKAAEEVAKRCHVTLRPVSETYFSGIDPMDKGNKGMTIVLMIAAIVMLMVAGINFANFTLAEMPMRIKGINTRKVLGVGNGSLRRSLVVETVVVSIVAFVLSVGAVYLLSLSPWVNSMIVGTLNIAEHLAIILAIAVASVAIGISVGIYPAYYATSFPAALVLKGSFGLTPRGQMLRKLLVGIQLFVAFVMTIYIGILFSQSHFIYNSDYGFDKEEILFTKQYVQEKDFDFYRTEMGKVTGVEGVAFIQTIPGTQDRTMTWGRGSGNKRVSNTIFVCDYQLPRLLGIEIVEGRDFAKNDENVYIVNEASRNKHPWISIDQPMSDGDMNVIGVCRNFRVYSARNDNSTEPAAFLIFGGEYKDWDMYYCVVAKVGKNVNKIDAKRRLEAIMKSKCETGISVPEFQFMDDTLQSTYEEEFRFIRQVELFSLICLIITLIGVFCLTMFETEYRRKEIGIRKVMGNTTADIVMMFCRHYTLLIVTAFLFAAPLAYYMAAQWLQNFAERTPIHWWLFPTALLAVSTIVLATVCVQTWRTARENPVNSIKNE